MAQDTNTYDRYDLGSGDTDTVHEELSDIIYNISPTETPFVSNIGRGKSNNTYREWSRDELADPQDNAHIDGDEFSGLALSKVDRLGTYHQISRKDLVVSRRANIVNSIGSKKEMARQIAKKGMELKRDVEFAATKRKVAVQGNSTTAMQTAGYPAWVATNIDRGSGGTAPTLTGGTTGTPNSVGTAGTARGLKESQILKISRMAYDEGGDPSIIMLPPQLKQGVSNFLFSSSARIATPFQDHGKKPMKGVTVVGAVDVYVADFQTFSIVPNRFSPSGTSASEVMIIDPKYWEITYLDGYRRMDIAKIGDHVRKMLVVDWGVCSKNDKASGIIADINEETAVSA